MTTKKEKIVYSIIALSLLHSAWDLGVGRLYRFAKRYKVVETPSVSAPKDLKSVYDGPVLDTNGTALEGTVALAYEDDPRDPNSPKEVWVRKNKAIYTNTVPGASLPDLLDGTMDPNRLTIESVVNVDGTINNSDLAVKDFREKLQTDVMKAVKSALDSVEGEYTNMQSGK